MKNKLKRNVGDTVTLHKKFGKDAGKKASIDSIAKYKNGTQRYRLRYKGFLDP